MSYQSSRLIENLIEDEKSYNEELFDEYQEEEVVEMVIELDCDRSVTLKVSPNDDPLTLARKFSYTYNVDPKVIQTLAMNITDVQRSSFRQSIPYEKLIKKQEKQNKSNLSNLNRSHLGKSRQTHQKQNSTFNEDPILPENSQIPFEIGKKSNVFDRLYNQSKTHKKPETSEIKIEKSQISYSTQSLLNNSQVKLYNKNLKLKEETIRKNQELKMKYEAEKQQEITYKPKINPVSDLIVSKLREFNGLNTSKSQQKILNRTVKYLREKQKKQLEQCTFHPNFETKRGNSRTSIQRHLLLHEDSLLRQQRAKQIKQHLRQTEENKKKPFINDISKKITEGRTFYDRLEEYKMKAQAKKQKIQKQKLQQTKRKPSTGRKPLHRNPSGQKIGDYLYNQASKRNRSQSVKQSKNHTNKKSQKIYEESKKNAFRYLFTLMDSDEDGLISSLKINIIDLNPEILQLLSPLLCEMQEIQAELDQQQFIDSLERLFTTYSVHEKNLLLNVFKNPHRKNKHKEDLSFQPQINQKSLEIIKQSREPGVSLYELGKQRAVQKQERMSELRAIKALMEYEECTFHPNLFHNHN